MTAREELEFWKTQHQEIKTEKERVNFFKGIEKKLLEKSDTEFDVHFEAFKSSLSDFKKEVKFKVEKSQLKVYPSSNEELELLKSLFSKMNIRFDIG